MGERDEKKVKRSVILYPFWESSYIHFATNHYNFSFWNMLSAIETNEKMQQFCQTQTHKRPSRQLIKKEKFFKLLCRTHVLICHLALVMP